MDNEIDLNKYSIRTDLVMEAIEDTKEEYKVIENVIENIKISSITIDKDHSKNINKKDGLYITIEFEDITDFNNREKVGKVLENEIKKMLKYKNINEDDECLIIGLGNSKSTPDALGPKVIESILVTKHLFTLNTNVKEGFRKVSSFIPGVMANTGIETSNIINNLVLSIKPKFIIVIDALAASSIERINKTIQMTDTGIHPGSGVGNTRKEISEETLGIPVIAIGVPTVVDSTIIVNDTINYLLKHLSYIKNNYDSYKLTYKRSNNYLNKIKNQDLNKEEKKEVIGILGTLSEIDKKNLISEVLNAINYNLIVTPKEIDFLIDKLSNLISSAINNSLHKEVNHY